MRVNSALAIGLGAICGACVTSSALAQGLGQPEHWQLGMQQAATPVAEGIHSLHTFLLWIISFITLFVLALLVYVAVKFNAKANPVPSRTTHNTLVEVAWTVVPVLILIAIAIPSFRLLYLQREIPQADMTLKATGNQWYWSYEYPDNGDVSFDSLMKQDSELAPGEPRLLAVDNPIVVPVGKTVRLIVTGADVIHSWTIPSFGVKIDAIPGRLNEDWFRAEKEGTFYGQCSELCGKDHAFMPIEVRVVPENEFNAWVEKAKSAGLPEANRMLAGMQAARGKLTAVQQ